MKSFPLRLLALLTVSLLSLGFLNPSFTRIFFNSPGKQATKNVDNVKPNKSAFGSTRVVPAKHQYDVFSGLDFKALKSEKWAGNGITNISLPGARLHIPSGAITSPRLVSITALQQADIPVLDKGMVNVTAGSGGYRFLPHGSHFAKPVALNIAYDATKIPIGFAAKDVITFFFDEKEKHWVSLPKDSVDESDKMVASTTTHFTDMIDAVIEVPESPATLANTPNTMSGIKYPDATAQIVTIAPPVANSSGSAALSYPITLPAGRKGMQPDLSVEYNNSGSDGWLGLGWDLSTPAVSIETRWGVPRYDANLETETYTIDGAQLSPVAHRATAVARDKNASEKQFYPRVNNDFQKIIRHGNSPSGYWWEVTDKNGTRRFFGGDPVRNSVDPAAVLTDSRGNVAYWALSETRDANNNFVKYRYVKVTDSATAGGNPGYNLYLDSITYTGNGNTEGKYSVVFKRDRDLREQKRTDISISAKLGFKQVTADLLRKINVRYNGQDIRSYELNYVQGAFYKTLLQNIKQFDASGKLFTTHNFDYYNDVQTNGVYQPLTGTEEWDPKVDNVKGTFLNPIPGFQDHASALSGNKSIGGGFGLAVTIGPDDEDLATKSNTAGIAFGFNISTNEGMLALVDINGDGLVDKVFKDRIDHKLYYRANQSAVDSNVAFGPRLPIKGINDFSQGLNWGVNVGLESNFFIYAGLGYAHSEDISNVYLTDVNADGLVDIVNNGTVYFNHLDPDRNPNFTLSSGDTPSPIHSSSGIDTTLVVNDPAVLQKAINDNPLHDVIKVWVAPFTGTVNINAPVALIQDTTSKSYPAADGVRVAIQQKGAELWSTKIDANDYTSKTPTGVSAVTVQKGDHIYFRVQSIFNGAYDQVHWTPQITYSSHVPGLNDANGQPIYQFQSDKDFLMSAHLSVGMPIDGTIHIQGNFTKPVTSDSIVVTILKEKKNVFTPLLEQHINWNQAVTVPVSIDQKVAKGENLFFRVSSQSNIDWTSLNWNPNVSYTAADDPKLRVLDDSGKALIQISPTVDFQAYTKDLIPSLPWTAPSSDTFSIEAKPTLNPNFQNGRIYFSVKKENELIAKETIPVTNGKIGDHPALTAILNSGDKVFFEYHTADTLVAYALDADTVIVHPLHSKSDTLQGGFHTFDNSFIFGPLYRHWGQFAYNGNRDRADQPIFESDLHLNPALMTKPDTVNLNLSPLVDTSNIMGSIGNMQNSYDGHGGYQPRDDKFIYLAPNNQRKAWIGYDNLTFVTRDTISSSRMGRDDLLPVNPVVAAAAGSASGAVGIKKVAQTDDFSVGVATPGGEAGVGASTGTTKFVYDFTDMNGDGYPDILSNSKIQYTNPNGSLEPAARSFGPGDIAFPNGFGDVTFSNHTSVGGTAGGSLAFSTSPNASKTSGGAKADAAEAKSKGSAGISGSFGVNFDNETVGFMDVNGDGLPDRVHSDGTVELNIGYSFLKAEQWGYTGLSGGRAISEGGGISINIENHSITAGISLTRSDNVTNNTLLDVNGDGLLDYIQGVDPLTVRLNTGNGFGPHIQWTGASFVNNSASSGESVNIGFTISISILPILPVVKLSFNPQITISQGADRTQKQFDDIDGDGFPDYLQSEEDSKLTVSRSTIRRTNLLKKVTRPLGGSFIMDYTRVGNTYDLPNSVWTLSRVDLFDGRSGDGPDATSSAYEYVAGKYNRDEREFYGFGKVITKELDTDHGNGVYRTTQDEYFTDNYYNKGILKSTVLKDAHGNKFTEVVNTIELKNISSGVALQDSLVQRNDGTAFPALVKTYKLFYQGQPAAGKTDSITYSYDLLGNLSRSTDFGDPGTDDDLSTATSYHSVTGKYIMNVPSSVTISGSGTTYRQRATDIDNNTGNIKQIRLYLTSVDAAKYDMTYDTYGNLKSITHPQNANGQSLAYNYDYDGDVQTYITKTSDSYNYSSSATYDVRFGQQLTSTDLDGQQTQYTLDAAGRILTIREPLEIASGQPFTIAFEYHPDDSTAWAMAKHYDPAHPGNYLETAAFRDGIGREVQTKKDIALFSGAKAADKEVMVVSGSTVFDAFFRPIKQWYPLTELKGTMGTYNTDSDFVMHQGMSYDVMDRKLTDTLPDLVVRKTTYGFGNDQNGTMQFKTTSSDANGISTESFLNVRELLKATKQQLGQGNGVWTSYSYNPVNELTKVTDDLGNVITMTYDQLGRKISDKHPDAGTTNYKYDLAGNLSGKITANLQGAGAGIKYTYDRERLTNITYPQNPQNNVTITYGAPGASFFRAGRIVTQQDASGTQQFFYNPLGATVKNIRVINVPDTTALTFTTQWTYDTWNRVTGMIYPDGETLTYNYNVGGSLQSMTGVNGGTSYNYLTQSGYDKFETRVFMQYGNGTQMTYTFGAQRRELAKMTAKTKASRFMMDNTYTWDNENEILNIVNAAPVPPNNLMGGGAAYNYTYDDLYRLTSANGSFSGSSHVDSFNLAMAYNTVSGITGKTQAHQSRANDNNNWVSQNESSYNYNYVYNAGSQPHSPIHIGTDAYTYDRNGNQLGFQDDVSAQNRQIIWDEENRVKTLSDNGQQFNYTYDAEGTRVLKSIGNGQTVSVNGTQVAKTTGIGNYTIYVNPYEDVTSGGYTKHFYIQGQRIVSKLGASGKGGSTKDGQQFYYHPDHLGNSAYITDASGEVYQHVEYYPFGETFIDEHGNQQNTPYLYNAKELDDETGLYYYGGRYYDPVTSVWPSVDPSWDLPTEISTSPYAYVQNNPITYIDPDGRSKWFSDLTAKQKSDLIHTLVENKKNQMARRAASQQNSNPNATQPSAAVGNSASMTSSNTQAGANGEKGAGKQYHLTLSVLGVNVLTSDPHKKTWLAGQKEKIAIMKKNWQNGKNLGARNFAKLVFDRQMWKKKSSR
jgi:RHS repeat-associated protein